MNNPAQPLPHIAVIGGGAGGIELAARLGRTVGGKGAGRARARITLIDRSPTHLWKPRLHEVATGLLAATEEEASYAAQAYLHGFEFALGEMTGLDPDTRTISLGPVPQPDPEPGDTRPLLPARTLRYDLAVIAIGSRVNDFGTPGVAAHCHMLDNAAQAERLHRAFLARAFQVQNGQAERLSVGIVGAGATGVELAAELQEAVHHLGEYGALLAPDRLDITIVDMADRVLPAVDPDTSAYARRELEQRGIAIVLGAKVTEVTPDALHLDGGRVIPAAIKVWASGVKGHDVVGNITGIQVSKGNQIVVDAQLRALRPDGRAYRTLFCLGDCAAFTNPATGQRVAPTAQAAHQQAGLLARSLRRVLRGAPPLPFSFRYKGTLVSLGARQAAGDLPGPRRDARQDGEGAIQIRGTGAKLIYIGLYRMHLAALYGWPRTVALTLGGMLRQTAQPPVKLH